MATVINGNDIVTGSGFTSATPTQDVPVFRAVRSDSTFSIPHAVHTKIVFDQTEVDTHNFFDTTNGRFQPTIAGWYSLIYRAEIARGSTESLDRLYGYGGVETHRGFDVVASNWGFTNSALLYFNGATDFAEFFVYQSSGSAKTVNGNNVLTFFEGYLVRAD